MEVLVVVPTYNEAENIDSLIQALFALKLDLGLLIVDDASPDGTGAIVDKWAEKNNRIKVLHRKGKNGLGTAYVEGFLHGLATTDAQYFVQMDADFSHDPNSIPDLIEQAKKNQVAIGSRYVPRGGVVNWGLGRRLLSRGGSFYARTVLGLNINDVTGGFKCWPRKALQDVGLNQILSDGYAFQAEMSFLAHKAGWTLAEVPITFTDRRVGQSKMSWAVTLEAIWIVPKVRFFSKK